MSAITALFIDITELLARFTVWDAIGVLTLWLLSVTVALTVFVRELRKILIELVSAMRVSHASGAQLDEAAARVNKYWTTDKLTEHDEAWRARGDAYYESIDPPLLDHTVRKMRKR